MIQWHCGQQCTSVKSGGKARMKSSSYKSKSNSPKSEKH